MGLTLLCVQNPCYFYYRISFFGDLIVAGLMTCLQFMQAGVQLGILEGRGSVRGGASNRRLGRFLVPRPIIITQFDCYTHIKIMLEVPHLYPITFSSNLDEFEN